MSNWLGGGASLTVEEEDGSPSVANVTKIQVSNATLTDDGSGTVSMSMSPAGGANTALSNLASVAINAALNTAAGTAATLAATLPAAVASTVAGVAANLTASAARAGTTNAGAAAGGNVVLTAGAAAQKTSGDANGGDIVLTPGAGIGTGTSGNVDITPAGSGLILNDGTANPYRLYNTGAAVVWPYGNAVYVRRTGDSSILASQYLMAGYVPGSSSTLHILGWDPGIRIAASQGYLWGSSNAWDTPDLGVLRSAAGVVKVTGGGNNLGSLLAGNATLTLLSEPDAPVITQGGTPGEGSYGYKVVAKLADGTVTAASSEGITATGNATLNGTNYNIITWSAVTGAASYDVYRTTGGATQGKIFTSISSPQNDIGGAASGDAPAVNSTGQVIIENAAGSGEILWMPLKALFSLGYVGTSGGANIACVSFNNYNELTDTYPRTSLTKDNGLTFGLGSATPLDVGLARSSAGVMKATDGSTGDGSIIAASAITAVGAAAFNGVIRTGVYKRAWTNAEVTAFGAVLSGDLKVATLPAKTIVRNAYLVIDSQASGTTTLTASLGRASTAYADYVVASDAMVAANTIYGNDPAEGGLNATGYDLPSASATTDVYIQFVATDATKKLADVLTCTGTVYLMTETLP